MFVRLVRWALVSVGLGAGIMGLAGQWRSPYLWAVAIGVAGLGLFALLRILDPELAQERFHPPSPGADARPLLWIRASAFTTIVLAPLDSGRLHWSPDVPTPVRALAVGLFLIGFWFTLRAMAANRFFSSVVRIQSDRGHHVVDAGPYRAVRHPGYLGMMITCPMGALALGSWLALLPAILYAGLILRRVIFEDRFLHANLQGYPAYAARVRFRLLPRLW